MKLIQLNVWMGKLSWAAMRFIEQEQPDIVCLQEVFQSDVEVTIPDRIFNCLDLLQKASGLEHCYFSPTLGVSIEGGTANFGNAILSRFPLENTETIFTQGEYGKQPTGLSNEETARTGQRNMQVVEVAVGSERLTIINHHGHWEATPLGTETSVEKMKLVAARARQVEGPLIVAGDLNVMPESQAMRVFDDWLEDIVAGSGAITTLSKVGRPLDVVCDHILTSKHIVVNSFTVKPDIVSDHLPLVLEFDIQPNRAV